MTSNPYDDSITLSLTETPIDGPMGSSLTDEQITNILERRAHFIAQAMRALMTDMNTYEECVSFATVASVMEFLPDLLNAVSDCSRRMSVAEEVFHEVRSLTGNTMGDILLQWTPHPIVGYEFDKRSWLDVAETLGPDNCQTLYHAAVFCTKVA